MRKTLKTLSLCVITTLVLTSICSFPIFAADTEKAIPTSSSVLINGASVSFHAYNINGNNYFKLRDLGKALSGTSKQFDIGYDSEKKAVSITTGNAYTETSENPSAIAETSAIAAMPSNSEVLIDGTKTGLTAYLINGNNYFKLRDVAAAIKFGVSYSSANSIISIDTSVGYTTDSGSQSTAKNPLIGAWHFDFGNDGTISYLIFKEDGTLVQFIGNPVGSYAINGKYMKVTDKSDGSISTYPYSFSTSGGKTILVITADQLGEMERNGPIANPNADTVKGLWRSDNEVYASDGDESYFYFSKTGDILIGITTSGTYTVNDNSFSDNITDDGSIETTTFELKTINGAEAVIMKSSAGDEIIMYKD